MSTVYPLAQSLFVNKQSESTSHQQTQDRNVDAVKSANNATAIEGEFIKIGDSTSFMEAQDMFERAKQYANMTNNAQNGLQTYTSLDAENQREALRELMGVDLYA